MRLNKGKPVLLQSLEKGCLAHIRPSRLLIFFFFFFWTTKVYSHATHVTGNTTVTLCTSKGDLYKTAECNANSPIDQIQHRNSLITTMLRLWMELVIPVQAWALSLWWKEKHCPYEQMWQRLIPTEWREKQLPKGTSVTFKCSNNLTLCFGVFFVVVHSFSFVNFFLSVSENNCTFKQ